MSTVYERLSYEQKKNRITFAQLENVLEEIGFTKTVLPDTGVVYRHANSDSMLVVRLHKPREVVPDYVMAATRLQLDEQGIIEGDDFDAMLRATAA